MSFAYIAPESLLTSASTTLNSVTVAKRKSLKNIPNCNEVFIMKMKSGLT